MVLNFILIFDNNVKLKNFQCFLKYIWHKIKKSNIYHKLIYIISILHSIN